MNIEILKEEYSRKMEKARICSEIKQEFTC
jgi:hypothetical protein